MGKVLMIALIGWIVVEFYHLRSEEPDYTLDHAIKDRAPLDCRVDANGSKTVIEDYSYQEDFYIVVEDKKLKIRKDTCSPHHEQK